MSSKNLLLFSPFSAIWDHALIELQIGLAAEVGGWNVHVLRCNGLMENMCVAMSAHRLTDSDSIEKKRKVCAICRSQRELLDRKGGHSSHFIESHLSDHERNETREFIKTLTAETFMNIEVKGIAVGRLSLYEYLLNHKKNNLVFNEHEWQEIQVHLTNSLNVLKALEEYWQVAPFNCVVIYNSLYSVNAVVAEFARQKNALVYFLHHGMNLAHPETQIMIGKNSTLQFFKKVVRRWPDYKNDPLSSRQARTITDHLLEVMSGRRASAYSPAIGKGSDLLQALKIPLDKKIIIVAMSSGDERFGIEVTGFSPTYISLFPTQVAWARFLVDWAKTRNDVCLVFRIHPREFPNKRDSLVSLQALELQELFLELPANVIVNWPEQNISLYDLVEYADIFLNAWSSVGKEMAMLGFPVVIYSKDLLWYPADINYLGETKETYLKAIDDALSKGWSIDHAIKAYRWMNLEKSTSHLALGRKFSRYPNFVKWMHRILRRLSRSWSLKFDMWRLRFQSESELVSAVLSGAEGPLDTIPPGSLITTEKERKYLKREYRRLIKFMYPAGRGQKIGGLYDRMRKFLCDS